jgi:predicted CXXCH cytochrome family protein
MRRPLTQSNATFTALFTGLIFLWGASSGCAQKLPQAREGPSVAAHAPLRASPRDYVGSERCAGCHRAEAQEFFKTAHAQIGEAPPPVAAPPGKPESPSVAEGRKIYNNMMCSACHKIGGQGGEGGPALDDVGVRLTRAQVMARMLARRAGTIMPTLPPNMPTAQIDDLTDYLMTLKGKPAAEAAPAAAVVPKTVTGCEMCHGPGRAHSDAEQAAGGNVAKQIAGEKLIFSFNGSPKENAERCLTCHVTGQGEDFFAHSEHQYAGISCNQCHDPHLVTAVVQPAKVEFFSAQREFYSVPALPEQVRWLHNNLLKESQPGLCYQCHATVQAQFSLPFHHRVPEGFMKCTDCHNPHGTMNHFMLARTRWETCVRCHVEERGPFLYEHPAVRVLGCVACHNPHGSVNNFLMVRREQRFLCLQCHTGFHGQAGVPHGRLGFQTSGNCTRCHVAIHGSNFDETLLR